jgi:hypothetical protein
MCPVHRQSVPVVGNLLIRCKTRVFNHLTRLTSLTNFNKVGDHKERSSSGELCWRTITRTELRASLGYHGDLFFWHPNELEFYVG